VTKLEIIREILARCGDPTAASETFKSLAWSLFTETAYEANASLSLVERQYYVSNTPTNHSTDGNGVATITSYAWQNYSDIIEIAVLTDSGYFPSRLLSGDEYKNMFSNMFLRPCSATGFPVPDEIYHYFDGRNILVITGVALGTISVQVRTLPDVRSLLSLYSDTSPVALHNSLIYKLIPVVAAKLKQEIGLVL
jgi:hypothetical protein